MSGHDHLGLAIWLEQLLALPFYLSLPAYLAAGWWSGRRGRRWPTRRYLYWLLGVAACLVAVTGPVAQRADHSFSGHMVVHLLLGMVGPLLLVRAAPVTLALRVLPVAAARRLSRLLASRVVGVLTHPVTAGAGNVAALFLLYRTDLYALSGQHLGLHLVVHVHLFVFGYLFAASIVGVDPDRHRTGFPCRAVVLVLYVAAHSVLAKQLYADPPPGVDAADARLGAQVLYYGGDAVDLLVMVLLCHRWYVLAAPSRSRHRLNVAPRTHEGLPSDGSSARAGWARQARR
ncbi:MAG TPA: cytochrome c oxidase assembly protein [Propionibacteriaceae bacterium]|nr:cytochrome c oxidase assembly protein [Propionibacteriaceae bacterium]